MKLQCGKIIKGSQGTNWFASHCVSTVECKNKAACYDQNIHIFEKSSGGMIIWAYLKTLNNLKKP